MSLFKNLHLAGSYSSYAVPLSLDAEAVRAMLPQGLELAPQGISPVGEHPVILNFGDQRRVRFQWGWLNGPGFNYQEFSVGIPFVQLTDSEVGPFFTTPRLYLTNGLAVILGYLWGFAKRKARIKAGIHAQDRYYDVRVGGDTIIAGEFKPLGSPGAPSQFPYYEELQKTMGATVFADKTIWGPIVCSTYELSPVHEVQPVEAQVHIPKPFLPGLPEGTIRVPGINQAKLGAFQTPLPTAWTMSMPMKCSSSLVKVRNLRKAYQKSKLQRLEKQTRQRVERVRNDPEGRYQLRVEFYEKYGFGDEGGPGYGTSELAFIRWEIERGVLNPLDNRRQPGSPWWRAVNEEFLYLSELAAAVYEEDGLDESGLSQPVKFWLTYIREPSPQSWYGAHNSSIASGYLDQIQAAKDESRSEQIFMNVVLYRLLYAQAIVEGAQIGLGELGEILADPGGPAVDVLVHLPDFYPDHYPLTRKDIKHIMDKGHSLEEDAVKFLDDVLILPHLSELYYLAAGWVKNPRLELLVRDNAPVYPNLSKRKIAVLGGGVGAMAAAFALTDPENPRSDDYEVTVYQMGWRLGGKGASGRNTAPPYHYRIEEHGVHIWFGFYDNAFRLMKKCYDELNQPRPPHNQPLRAPDAPLGTWDAAFKPYSHCMAEEYFNGAWHPWPGEFPTNPHPPGEGTVLPVWDYVAMAVQIMHERFQDSSHSKPSPTGDEYIRYVKGIEGSIDEVASEIETGVLNLGIGLLRGAHGKARELDADDHSVHSVIVDILRLFMAWYWEKIQDRIDTDIQEHRLWIQLNFIFANLSGVIQDQVLTCGFDHINDVDYREWLGKYAYPDKGRMVDSSVVRGIYDALFAYAAGDFNQPSLEAGTTLRAATRGFLTYRGAIIWKMQAGMGDTIFAPLYQALKARGVKFEFFQRVKRIHPSADNQAIERIDVGRQVTITKEQQAKGGYDPLIDVNGLPCWPSTPFYDQIVEGEKLKKEGINLESYCSGWEDVAEKTLTRGVDFDDAILGISLGALPYVACDLIRSSDKWRAMVNNVQTVRTQAFQLWLKPTAYGLGWTEMERPILCPYNYEARDPLDTWADMSHLIAREAWPTTDYPLNIAYFCGTLLDESPPPDTECGPRQDCRHMDQKAADDRVKAKAIDFLKTRIKPLWPNAVFTQGSSDTAEFDWDLLVDDQPGEHQGEARFDSQYWRANISPPELYVLSVPGSSKHRLPANDPHEFSNLYLAGDWTKNGLDLGCVESAAMSGLLASLALSGYPKRERIVTLDL